MTKCGHMTSSGHDWSGWVKLSPSCGNFDSTITAPIRSEPTVALWGLRFYERTSIYSPGCIVFSRSRLL